jgi:hypothetical protein
MILQSVSRKKVFKSLWADELIFSLADTTWLIVSKS